MSDATLTLLKFGLLAFLYLFLAWVVWTSTQQLRARNTVPSAMKGSPPNARPTQARKSQPVMRGELTVLEPAEIAGTVLTVGDNLSVGRAAACSLTLDDTFVSQHHASFVWRDGRYVVEDAGSTNGTYVNRERVVTPVVLQTGDTVQIGSTVLEFS